MKDSTGNKSCRTWCFKLSKRKDSFNKYLFAIFIEHLLHLRHFSPRSKTFKKKKKDLLLFLPNLSQHLENLGEKETPESTQMILGGPWGAELMGSSRAGEWHWAGTQDVMPNYTWPDGSLVPLPHPCLVKQSVL